MTYDYIIVGAGSAGCVLASRLSADPDTRVLLVEAGGASVPADVRIPSRWRATLGSDVDWGFVTTPQSGLGGRVLDYQRGKTLGGTSAINAMIYIRGNPRDYDGWRDSGNPGWGYEDVLSYFLRSEDRLGPPSRFHGTGGPLHVSEPATPHPLALAFVEAATRAGHRRNEDFNGDEQLGAGLYQRTIRNGRRHSTADAFLDPVLERPNLSVRTDTLARHITIEGGRVTGVELTRGTDAEIVTATREVILSAGAIGSPFLLLHSGIGPADRLQQLGINVAVDVPGVGGNLQDHPTATLQCVTDGQWSIADDSNIAEAGAFMRSPRVEVDAAPELQCHFLVGGWSTDEGRFVPGEVQIAVHVLRPLSRGSLTLVSADPRVPPAIDLGLLREPADAEMLADGVELLRDITAAEPLASALSGETLPGRDVIARHDLERAIRETGGHVWHPVGTCRMGVDDSAVVDDRLRIRGVDGLRVADASIMPTIVSGNTNAPTIMIAERAADLILAG